VDVVLAGRAEYGRSAKVKTPKPARLFQPAHKFGIDLTSHVASHDLPRPISIAAHQSRWPVCVCRASTESIRLTETPESKNSSQHNQSKKAHRNGYDDHSPQRAVCMET